MMPLPSTCAYFSKRNVPTAPPPAAAISEPRPPVLTITAAASAIGTSVARSAAAWMSSVEAALLDRPLDQLLAGALELRDVGGRACASAASARSARRRRGAASARSASSRAATAGPARLARRMARLAAEVAHELLPERAASCLASSSRSMADQVDARPRFVGRAALAAQARAGCSRCRGGCGAASCASCG